MIYTWNVCVIATCETKIEEERIYCDRHLSAIRTLTRENDTDDATVIVFLTELVYENVLNYFQSITDINNETN